MIFNFLVLLILLPHYKCNDKTDGILIAPSSFTFRPKSFPLAFNAANAWPECEPIINYIDNQHFFQTCLYTQITHVLSDRLCIETKGKVMVALSAWNLMTCCPNKKNIFKCLHEKGVTTGGSLQHVNSGCHPYEAERCTRQNIQAKHNSFSSKCLKSNATIGYCMVACANRLPLSCQTECADNKSEPLRFYADGSNSYLNYGIPVVAGPGIEEWMMQELMLNGPIVAMMNYTLDGYNGGIIRDIWDTFTSDDNLHIVRIVGWDHGKNNNRHWLVANSYGREFGENGMFRIEWGRNLMNIERIIIAPRPDLARLPETIKQHGLRMNLTYLNKEYPSFNKQEIEEFNTFVEWIL